MNQRRQKPNICVFSLRTRSRRGAGGLGLLKPALLLLSVTLFVLVIVPFAITSLFTAQETQEQTPTQAEAAPKEEPTDTSDIQQESVPASITVYRSAIGKTEKVPFEIYVKGVVSSEMPSTFEEEALKAQSVAARTYSLSKYLRAKKNGNPAAHSSAPVCDTVHCQVYQGKQELKKNKGSAWMNNDWKKISAAVDATKGQLMYYDGQLVEQALFHSSSGGKTENCEDVFAAAVPYLVSVESPYEEEATHQKETETLTISEFAEKIKRTYPGKSFGTVTASNIKIRSHSSGGRVETMQVGSASVTGKQVREALGLYSANFTISIAQDKITFTTTGSGHGVGMSQYGANGMAKAGYSYKEILRHYYSGTVIL
ncbi:stage II sporulation protein D [Clostridiales bacterium]|nr:stage II sporulation protein D [Clostridiales bacterium]